MAWDKSTRILIMLAIDVVFFIVELVAGIIAHSLALQADAFHMLNDIISLAIGLWAVTVARKATSDKYTYGWLRAEIIGAFFNAIFLIALCVSIILEAVTRFIEPPEIKEPQIILIVGCFGLASNLLGFWVLGGHGHSHGGHSHDHDHGDAAHNGHAHSHAQTDDHDHDHGHSHSHSHDHAHDHSHDHSDDPHAAEEGRATITADSDNVPDLTITRATTDASDASRRIRFAQKHTHGHKHSESRDSIKSPGIPQSPERNRRRRRSSIHSRFTNIDDMSFYPASFRQEIIAASRGEDGPSSESEPEDNNNIAASNNANDEPSETSPLLKSGSGATDDYSAGHPRTFSRESTLNAHDGHNHSKPKTHKKSGGGHGHSHDDMGMNAMVLHVIGDALGNVGVIVTALIVWLTDYSWKNYADPAVSLFITFIILRSALPLTFATAKVLLQATPDAVNVVEIRQDIEALRGIVSCHHMHVWQLSETKLVASMHIKIEFPISESGGRRYMELARSVRECLHEHGIHSATIQPEFCHSSVTGSISGSSKTAGSLKKLSHPQSSSGTSPSDIAALQIDGAAADEAAVDAGLAVATDGGAAMNDDSVCLLECIENCIGQGCCDTVSGTASQASSRRDSHSSHDGHHH